jgi:hypothetical protein
MIDAWALEGTVETYMVQTPPETKEEFIAFQSRGVWCPAAGHTTPSLKYSCQHKMSLQLIKQQGMLCNTINKLLK